MVSNKYKLTAFSHLEDSSQFWLKPFTNINNWLDEISNISGRADLSAEQIYDFRWQHEPVLVIMNPKQLPRDNRALGDDNPSNVKEGLSFTRALAGIVSRGDLTMAVKQARETLSRIATDAHKADLSFQDILNDYASAVMAFNTELGDQVTQLDNFLKPYDGKYKIIFDEGGSRSIEPADITQIIAFTNAFLQILSTSLSDLYQARLAAIGDINKIVDDRVVRIIDRNAHVKESALVLQGLPVSASTLYALSRNKDFLNALSSIDRTGRHLTLVGTDRKVGTSVTAAASEGPTINLPVEFSGGESQPIVDVNYILSRLKQAQADPQVR